MLYFVDLPRLVSPDNLLITRGTDTALFAVGGETDCSGRNAIVGQIYLSQTSHHCHHHRHHHLRKAFVSHVHPPVPSHHDHHQHEREAIVGQVLLSPRPGVPVESSKSAAMQIQVNSNQTFSHKIGAFNTLQHH